MGSLPSARDAESLQPQSTVSSRHVRIVLLASSIVLAFTGGMACLAPLAIAVRAPALIGYSLVVAAICEGIHWLVRSWRYRGKPQVDAPMGSIVLVHGICGIVLLTWPQITREALAGLLLLILAAEGAVMVYVGIRISHAPARWAMFLSGIVSMAVAAVMVYRFGEPTAAQWVGWLIGAKLILLAGLFAYAALLTSDADIRAAYFGLSHRGDQPQVGSIYAVFYGPAFHCGIVVGPDEVVDYLTDGVVRHIRWPEFLLGRKALQWDYPDVPAAPVDEIVRFARQLVGRKTKYNALEFNCENLAIYCRSAGKTCSSRYAQAIVGLELVRRYPWLGSLLQLVNRGTSWLLYGLGGPLGHRAAFAFVWLTTTASNWLVVRPLQLAPQTTNSPVFSTPGGVAAARELDASP